MAYTYTNLRDQIVDPIRFLNTANNLTIRNTINRAARLVAREIDLDSMKTKATLASKIFDNVYDYTAPSDLKGNCLIDLIPQGERNSDTRLSLVTAEKFDRLKTVYNNLVSFEMDSGTRKLRASIDVDDTKLTVSEMDTLTDTGSWVLFGDGTNLTADTDNYISGGGAINWDISAAGGTTAGIQNTTMTQFDITRYTADGSAFVWAYITSITNLTNFILRIGNDASNYYSMTATTMADGNAFQNGWNLIRFDFSGKTTTGSVTATTCDYVALYMTKAAGKISETDYRFDNLQLHTGVFHEAYYYSMYPWKTSGGTWIENSTADTDIINADLEEYELFVYRGRIEVMKELKEWDLLKDAQSEYQLLKTDYQRKNPSEALKFTQVYY